MPGAGVIPLRALGDRVRTAGFDGYDELELFSERNWWQRDPEEVIDVAIARHREIFGDDGLTQRLETKRPPECPSGLFRYSGAS